MDTSITQFLSLRLREHHGREDRENTRVRGWGEVLANLLLSCAHVCVTCGVWIELIGRCGWEVIY